MKNAAYYRRLPYRRRVQPRDDGGQRYFIAWIDELPAIEIHGPSADVALIRLDEIFDDCIESMIEAGDPIPEPAAWPHGYETGLPLTEKSKTGGLFRRFAAKRREPAPPSPVKFSTHEEAEPWQTADQREHQTA